MNEAPENIDSAPIQVPTESIEPATVGANLVAAERPWVSCVAIVICIGIFLGISTSDVPESGETLSKFGWLPGPSVWRGEYWALVTSAFVHNELWHLAFNMYWLWRLGSRLERAIGSLPFLAFIIVAAFVSSSFELAASGGTGIGASGFVYAIFGFMWPTRSRYPHFCEVLDPSTIRLFNIWLLGCIVATWLNVWQIGNAAHITGLMFGGAVAGAFVVRFRPRLMFSGLTALVVLSVIPLFWCPWSVGWLSVKAYDAHLAKRYEVALGRYTQIIQREPNNSWAYLNRSGVYQELNQPEKAKADFDKAHEIDPSIGRVE